MEAFDSEYDSYQQSLNEMSECRECLAPVDLGIDYCSNACYEASLL